MIAVCRKCCVWFSLGFMLNFLTVRSKDGLIVIWREGHDKWGWLGYYFCLCALHTPVLEGKAGSWVFLLGSADPTAAILDQVRETNMASNMVGKHWDNSWLKNWSPPCTSKGSRLGGCWGSIRDGNGLWMAGFISTIGRTLGWLEGFEACLG